MLSKTHKRTAWVKLRVTPEEKELIYTKAHVQGQTVTDFLRQRALAYRLRQTAIERERVRQLARIGANLNQLARWANTYKSHADAFQIVMALRHFENVLVTSKEGGPSCT